MLCASLCSYYEAKIFGVNQAATLVLHRCENSPPVQDREHLSEWLNCPSYRARMADKKNQRMTKCVGGNVPRNRKT